MSRHVTLWSVLSAIAFVAMARGLSAREAEPTLMIDDVKVQEADTGSITAVLTVSLVNPVVHGDIHLGYSTLPGTATEGTACLGATDYVGARQQGVTISSRENSAHIAIQVCGDTWRETNETFIVELLDASRQGVIAKGHVTIVENDPAPVPWAGLIANGTIAKSEERRWQTPVVAPGQYHFTMSNTNGDSDLYVEIGRAPTVTSYSCRPAKSGDENCTLNISQPAGIHIMVRGYTMSSTFKLVGIAQ